MKYFNSLAFILIFNLSCNTESPKLNYNDRKIPVSIAKNFTMTYTDSMLTKSFVSGKIHYDFSNDLLNYSEFFEDVEVIIYDENKTTTINSVVEQNILNYNFIILKNYLF